ncbi:MAG TPA: YggS family pyridoxal phosphate-dependent enzyme [Roseiflexaceae bacterium]|nr:YggS family pyridoxal phosphate-dependent enzyme [Roseiflexaceae bacterium]
MDTLAERISAVRERIAAAALRAGRSPAEVRLVGVTKTHPPEVVAAALAAGLAEFGENRVQEAETKIGALAAERARITWHLIGHLQRNKAGRAAAIFDMVHSVDSLRLAEALDRQVGARAGDAALPLPILLQVNVSGEATKEGFDLAAWRERPAALEAFLADVERILALPHLEVRGLMTIAPWGEDPGLARPTFRATRDLRDLLARRFPAARWPELSMGMTDDFEVAIEEGATIVRVGRAIFGSRG